MANTTSLKFPNMFNVSQNRVSILEDRASIVNRDRLLMLTEPTELYNSPDFGVGLSRYMWQYNSPNVRAMMLDRIKYQLSKYEPKCIPEDTEMADGLLFTGDHNTEMITDNNELNVTVSIKSTFNDTVKISLGSTEITLE